MSSIDQPTSTGETLNTTNSQVTEPHYPDPLVEPETGIDLKVSVDIDSLIANYDIGERFLEGEGTSKQEWSAWEFLNQCPRIDIAHDFPEHSRVVILAPHPDDEILGCAGLLQHLLQLERQVLIVAITNGTGSHPDSTVNTPEYLAKARPAESIAAFKALHLKKLEYVQLHLPDGKVAENHSKLKSDIESLIQADDILVCTHVKDGHPDHEFSAHVALNIAKQHQLKIYQVLVWTWHWACPEHPSVDWHQARRLDLSPTQIKRKESAIRCFKSQIEPDLSTGQAPILAEFAIQRLLMPFEVYLHENDDRLF